MIDRLLIVGGGFGVRTHLVVARELLPKAQIAVVSERAPRKPRGADALLRSLPDALDFAPTAAVVANPAPFHIETALALAERGIHLLVEKPIAASSERVPELIARCEMSGVVLMTGYLLRFMPSLDFFRKAVRRGLIGPILSVRAEVGQNLRAWRPGDYRKSASAQRKLGGGVLLELSHEVDYLRWIFGEITWVEAVARTQSDMQIDTEDTALMTCGIKPASGNEILTSLALDFVRHDPIRTCIAIGAKGTLRWDGVAGSVSVYKASTHKWQKLFGQKPKKNEAAIAEWRHFLHCIKSGKRPLVTGEDGLAVLKAIEAAREAARSRAMVTL